MAEAQPRVNSALLPKYIGKQVRLPCMVSSFSTSDPNVVTVKTSDEGEVSVRLVKTTPKLTECKGSAEIIGKVIDGSTIQLISVIDMEGLDLAMSEKLIKLWHKPDFTNIFSPSAEA